MKQPNSYIVNDNNFSYGDEIVPLIIVFEDQLTIVDQQLQYKN
jgi:hypothetical protein